MKKMLTIFAGIILLSSFVSAGPFRTKQKTYNGCSSCMVYTKHGKTIIANCHGCQNAFYGKKKFRGHRQMRKVFKPQVFVYPRRTVFVYPNKKVVVFANGKVIVKKNFRRGHRWQ